MRHGPLILLPAFVFAMVACSGSDDATTGTDAPSSEMATMTTVATTSVPETLASEPGAVEVFSFADDDLCEWLSPATIAALVAAEYEWNGTASEGGFTDLPDGCAWELSGTPDVEGLNTVLIGSAPAPQEPFLDYDDLENTTSKLGVGVRGHPALSDGVIYSYGGFGYAAFGVPERGYIQVYLWVPGDEGTEDARFAFADAVIRELGWTP